MTGYWVVGSFFALTALIDAAFLVLPAVILFWLGLRWLPVLLPPASISLVLIDRAVNFEGVTYPMVLLSAPAEFPNLAIGVALVGWAIILWRTFEWS